MPKQQKPDEKVPGTDLSTEQITEITTKKRRGLSVMTDFNADPGDNARYVRDALVAWNLPPIDISDPKQVETRIGEYFAYCSEHDKKPGIVGLANWLGVSRDTLQSWKRGEYRSKTHSAIIQKAVQLLEDIWSDFMLNGKINPASGIFLAKNWYQYSDTQQIVVTPNNPLDNLSDDQATKRIMDAIPSDDDTIE